MGHGLNVSPEGVHETGVWPRGQSGSPIVAAEAEQVEGELEERPGHGSNLSFCALQADHSLHQTQGGSECLDAALWDELAAEGRRIQQLTIGIAVSLHAQSLDARAPDREHLEAICSAVS